MVLCLGQVFHQSLSGAVAGSFVGMPGASFLSQDARADLGQSWSH